MAIIVPCAYGGLFQCIEYSWHTIIERPSLKDHHEQLCANHDTNHKIHNLLPDRNQPSYNLRQERTFNIPI